MSITRRTLVGAGAAALALGTTRASLLAQTIDKPARMVVGFPPGGSIDLVARLVASQMKSYAPTLIVDNKPGAGGRIALEHLKNAPADGSVFALTPSSMLTIYPHVFKSVPYDPFKDFTMISPVCEITFGLAVGPKVPDTVKTLADLVAWYKANPKEASLGFAAAGSSQHFIAMMFARAADLKITEVPYKGGGPSIQDLLAGQIPAVITVPSTIVPHVAAGKLRALGTTGPRRDSGFQTVPTFAEQGFKDIVIDEWFGVVAPAGTPAPVAAKLHEAVVAAAGSADVQAGLTKASLTPAASAQPAFAERLKSDYDRWKVIVASTGYKPVE